jgi:hypothetical protein
MEDENKPNVLVFGSCLSNLTAARLVAKFNFKQTHSVHHNRSDVFIDYHLEKNKEMIPLDYLESHLFYKKPLEKEARQFLRNQYAEYLGFHDLLDNKREGHTFFDDIEEFSFDVILLDNFMDIAAKLVTWKTHKRYSDRKIFLNIGFYENEAELTPQFWHDEYLTPKQSVENWIRIYRWIREKQPKAKIYFLSYHYCSSLTAPDRFARIKGFYTCFSEQAKACDLVILPPLNVRPSLTKGEVDWPHFDDAVYDALAGIIFLDYESDLLAELKEFK